MDNRLKVLMKALNEYGTKELAGDANSERVLQYHKATDLMASADSVAWCSAFVNWIMKECGIKGTNKANARSWCSWGNEGKGLMGEVAVFWRDSPEASTGHVAIVIKKTSEGVWVLGGNQGDMVNIAFYPRNRVLTYRTY